MGNVIELHPLCKTCGVEMYRDIVKGECSSCVSVARERKAEARTNPVDLNNRRNYLFDGYDMRYFRFKLSDLDNGLTRKEAKAMGLTLTVNGRKRTYTDKDGVIQFVYSYDACIYARVYDKSEGVWRDVFNFTPYSVTSRKHQSEVCREILGIGHYQWVNGQGHVTCEGEYPDYVTTQHPFSQRARLGVEFVRCSAHISHEDLTTEASDFVNRDGGEVVA